MKNRSGEPLTNSKPALNETTTHQFAPLAWRSRDSPLSPRTPKSDEREIHGRTLHIGTRHELTRLPDYPEPVFMAGATAACGDRFFAFGGSRWDAAKNAVAKLSTAHAFSTIAGCWEKLAPLPAAVRGITALVLDDAHILLAGGYQNDTDEFTDDAFIYDITSGKYTATQPRSGERSEVEECTQETEDFCSAPPRRLRPSCRARLQTPSISPCSRHPRAGSRR